MKTELQLLLLVALPGMAQAEFAYMTNDSTILITGYTGPGGPVSIPGAINGLPVTGIGYLAFARMPVTRVTIPDSVTSIWDFAFAGCTNLTSITIPDSVGSISQDAFYECASLSTVTIGNGLSSIPTWAFGSCTALTNVTFGKGVKSIQDDAFEYCTGLRNITIPDSVTNIGRHTFADATNLMGVYFQGNAPSADRTSFAYDDKATVYYLPGTTGWGSTFAGRPTALWQPQVQAAAPGLGKATDGPGFTIAWASGMTVIVEACIDLTNPTWVPVATNTVASGPSWFSDPRWTNYPASFYRIRSQ